MAEDSATVEAPKAAEEKATEEPKEKPLNVDVLNTCTSRFDRQGWNIFLEYKTDMDKIRFARIDVNLTARSEGGAQAIAKTLTENHAPGVKQTATQVVFRGTFEQLQSVIRDPETASVMVRKAD